VSGFAAWISEIDSTTNSSNPLARHVEVKQADHKEHEIESPADKVQALKESVSMIATTAPNQGETETLHIAVPESYHVDVLVDGDSDDETAPIDQFPEQLTVKVEHCPDDPRMSALSSFLHSVRSDYNTVQSRKEKGRQEYMDHEDLSEPGLKLIKDKYEYGKFQLACRCPYYQQLGFCKHQLEAIDRETVSYALRVNLNGNCLWDG
jgi:hypothetical protein